MRASHKSRVGKTNNKMFFMWLNFFPKNINKRLKTLTFLVVAHKQTAGLNGLQVAENSNLPALILIAFLSARLTHSNRIRGKGIISRSLLFLPFALLNEVLSVRCTKLSADLN